MIENRAHSLSEQARFTEVHNSLLQGEEFDDGELGFISCNPFNLDGGVAFLKNGGMVRLPKEAKISISDLVLKGMLHSRYVLQLAHADKLYGAEQVQEHRAAIETARDFLGLSEETPMPRASDSLEQRLYWTLADPPEQEELAREKRRETTDLVRGTLIPRYHKRGLDFVSQVRLIHRAHMRNNEHLVLSSGQSRSMLRKFVPSVDRLGGKVRSEQKLATNIGLAGWLIKCASYEDTPDLLQQLGEAADILFPIDGKNDQVTEENIYHYLSFFQTFFAIIHPFYEGNGRTSEDLMYVLWQRRPDLAHTVRYLSSDGYREDDDVQERMRLINTLAVDFIHTMTDKVVIIGSRKDNASTSSVQTEQEESFHVETRFNSSSEIGVHTYQSILLAISKVIKKLDLITIDNAHENTTDAIHQEAINVYDKLFTSYMSDVIDRMISITVPDEVGNLFDELVDNLEQASTIYTLSDGNVLT